MLTTKDKFHELINDILFASSQESVKDICDKTIHELAATTQRHPDIRTFAGNAVAALELFSPMDKTAQQWSNINMAKICFRHYSRDHSAQEAS